MMLKRLRDHVKMLGLKPVSRGVRRDGLTYLVPEKLRRIERAAEEMNSKGVEGAFVEFGVALGGSGIILATLAGGRPYIGLDVFGMIPPPTSGKDDRKSKERYETIKKGEATGIAGQPYYGYREDLLADVTASFARYGVPVDQRNVSLVKGLFEDTWPSVRVDRIALAHIDCDWYDPVKFCLKAVDEKLSKGGIIIIDDYFDYGGCRTAVDEFLMASPDYDMEDGRNPYLRKGPG